MFLFHNNNPPYDEDVLPEFGRAFSYMKKLPTGDRLILSYPNKAVD